MRMHELPDGTLLDLDVIVRVGPVNICKHDSQYDNYEVYVSGSDSINIMINTLPRDEFVALLTGAP